MPRQEPRQVSTTAAADGTGEVIFYPTGNDDMVITRTSVLQVPPAAVTNPAQPIAQAYHNGLYQEGSNSGGMDTSDTRFVILAGDEYSIRWIGAEPGSELRATLRTVRYPFGTAPLE